MSNFVEFWFLREIGTGVVAFLMLVMSIALGRFLYMHRVVLTVEDREAREAAIGLVIVFLGLAARAFDLWLAVVATRRGWPVVSLWSSSAVAYFISLLVVLFGAMLSVRAFHPWPLWALLLGISVGIPVGIGLL